VSRATFRSLPWRSRSQHDLAAKSCLAHNFVIWSRISKIFHRNDHHVEAPCRAQHFSRYLEGQCHSMTLQQNRVWPITSLFKVGFRNYYTEMTTMLNRRVAHKIWVLTLKVKVTAWPCSKIVSGPYFCNLKSDFETISQKWSPYWDDVSRATFGSLHWISRSQHDQQNSVRPKTLLFKVGFYNYFWQTTSLWPIPIRGALPGSDRLLFSHLKQSYKCRKWLHDLHLGK